MKKVAILKSLIFLISILALTTTNGQIGRQLKSKIGQKLSSQKTVLGNGVKLDFSSSPFMPAITMHSLLSDGLQLTVDGKLTTPNLKVNFLPTKTSKGERANYDEYKKENLLLHAELMNIKISKMIGLFHYSVNPASKVDAVMNQKMVDEDNFQDFHKVSAGHYELHFFAGGEHFYTFPFEVVAMKNEDPYAAFSEILFLKGAWEDWNYFDVQETAGKKIMVWHHFMDNTTTNIENEFRTEKNCDYKFRYELFRNGQLFGAHDSRMNASKGEGYNLKIDYAAGGSRRTHWVDNGVQVSRIPGEAQNWDKLEFKDFSDGTYKMVVYTLDCANNEKKRTFLFEVSNGKFVYHPQQNRKTHKDQKTIVEGGPEKFWFKSN